MNELRAIIEAFDEANVRGERCALATVVSVEGSSYRAPGARMLVCEGGVSTGSISAGCLESDVIEHAKRVIKTNLTKLVEYDTTSTSDEIVWGLGLGCNGIVRVLVEPLARSQVTSPRYAVHSRYRRMSPPSSLRPCFITRLQ